MCGLCLGAVPGEARRWTRSPGAEVKVAVKEGKHAPSPVGGVSVLKEVTGSSIYIFKQEPDCTKEHFPNAGPSGWDKQQALSTRVRTRHTPKVQAGGSGGENLNLNLRWDKPADKSFLY